VHVAASLFLGLRTKHADVLDVVDRACHQRQRHNDDRQLTLTRDVTSRLATSLLRWARDFGEPTPHGLRMYGLSQRDIAQAIGASEKSVEAAFRVLRSNSLISTWRLNYLIFEPRSLEAAVDRAEWRSVRSP
jgi:CRP-like cAMP-binding protein